MATAKNDRDIFSSLRQPDKPRMDGFLALRMLVRAFAFSVKAASAVLQPHQS